MLVSECCKLYISVEKSSTCNEFVEKAHSLGINDVPPFKSDVYLDVTNSGFKENQTGLPYSLVV